MDYRSIPAFDISYRKFDVDSLTVHVLHSVLSPEFQQRRASDSPLIDSDRRKSSELLPVGNRPFPPTAERIAIRAWGK